jgi:hypothetical protein
MGGVWLAARTDVRRRWPSIVALTLLVALAGAFVLTAATGARRADSALERLLDATEMWDGSIEVDYPETDAVVADVATQPEVAAASAAVLVPVGSEELEGGVIAGLAPRWLRDVYRPRIITGRLPDPRRDDELLVNEVYAQRYHLVPGDVVVLEDFVGAGIAQPMSIVGIHRGVLDLALGDSYPGAIATEAFGRRFGAALYAAVAGTPIADQVRPQVVARMRDDVGNPLRVLAAVADRHDAARPRVVGRSPFISPLERTLAVQVEAFWILTAVSGVSALLLLGMAVARLAAGGTHSNTTLRALGFESRSRALVMLVAPALVAILGCTLAVTGAVVASPVVPLGSARVVEPDSGIWVDPGILLVGALMLVGSLLAVATVSALAVVRVYIRHAPRKPRTSRVTRQLPLPAVLGQDLAYRESGLGRLALAAVGVGLALIVSVAVYSASLDHLIDSPSLFGSDFEVTLFPADGEPEEAFNDVDLDDPAIEGAAITRGAQVNVAGELLEAHVIEPVRGVVGGTILRGRAPRAGDEVALGPTTVNRLGLGVGDEVTIAGARRRSMRIVGEAVLPPPGQAAYGDVLWLTPPAADRLEVELQQPELLLKLAEGISKNELATIIGDHSDLAVHVPDDVTNLNGVGEIRTSLAVFGVLLGGAVLAFALVGIVRRRRHDLAILRTLGLRPRQITASMLTASLLIVGPGAAVGVALGVVLGRGYWSIVAARVPAVAQPVVPLALAALVVLAALVIGCLLVVGPARLVATLRPADVLQRD